MSLMIRETFLLLMIRQTFRQLTIEDGSHDLGDQAASQKGADRILHP